MNTTSFRWLVGTSIVLLFGGMAALLAIDQNLPPELSAWVNSDSNLAWSVIDILSLVILATSFIASIGLLLFTPWSRWLYAAATIGATVITLVSGPTVYSAPEAFFTYLMLLLDGFIICAAFFSDVRVSFKRTREARPV